MRQLRTARVRATARACALTLLAFMLVACGGLRWNSQLYRVRAGETLYAIAWRYNLDYRELARWNRIPAPYVIYPGQELVLSETAAMPAQPRQSAAVPARTTPSGGAQAPRAGKNSGAQPDLPPPRKWIWPTRGRIVRAFQGQQSIAQGIDIEGVSGQDVVASADGRVVYSGSGLTGFGQLVIIKQNDTYISAYGHNSRLLVKEGDEVKAGQKIAEMGKQQGKPCLHFEIRRQGKPVDPLKYLPKP